MREKIAAGLAAIVLGLGISSCTSNGDECASMQGMKANGTYISANYKGASANGSSEYECPPGCTLDGETSTTYCCWCPD
jgi:hypothetical protein